jgi:hypothetical protein
MELMTDFQGLISLKSVFLAPLTRPRARTVTARLPGNSTSFITRHDHHNIEVKTVSELTPEPSVVETDIFFFVPRSFELPAVGKNELIRDFRSRMRVALPACMDHSARLFESSLAAFDASLDRLQSELQSDPLLDPGHPLCEELLESTKDLCAVVAGVLKNETAETLRQLFLSHTLMTTEHACIEGLLKFGESAVGVQSLIDRMRSIDALKVRPFGDRTSTLFELNLSSPLSVFDILDEYVSQLYVQYLVKIRSELSKQVCPQTNNVDPANYAQARFDLESSLDRLQAKEARYRQRFGASKPSSETEIEREHRLLRLSHLKKFFQSKTFVDVSRRPAGRGISESTATIGTAMAAIVAALVERFSRPEITDVAFQGLFVLSFGVIFYVLRDRLKDRAKTMFQRKVSQILPDFEQQLVAGERRIGTVKEWFRILARKDVPESVLRLRREHSASEMESRLPEDVFHCRKVQEVHSDRISNDRFGAKRALHENTRVNIERYLKHMDDPFKDFNDLDLSGRVLRSRSHRIYHFYICVRNVARPLETPWKNVGLRLSPAIRNEQILLSRVVLDKNGVVRIEDLLTQ